MIMAKTKEKPKSWKDKRKIARHSWTLPFVWFEWCCEWISYWFSHWAFLEVLEYLGKLSLLGALFVYIFSAGERREAANNQKKAKQYQAWQMINSASGLAGDGGRKLALEDLNGDDVRLDGINLNNAVLHSVVLKCAIMKNGNLNNTDLSSANISLSTFYKATFLKSYSVGAWFRENSFIGAVAKQAVFINCHFKDSTFEGADLRGAEFADCEIKNSRFNFSDLRNATFSSNLETNHNYFYGANIQGIKASPSLQATMIAQGAVMIEKDALWEKYKREQGFDLELQEMRFEMRP